MINRDLQRRLRAGSAIVSVGLMLGMAAAAQAQTAPSGPTTPSQLANDANAGADKDAGQDIVVTGSLFRRADLASPSPVTVLTADSLGKAGITSVADAIRTVSADSAGSIGVGFTSGFSAGGVAVSLRGLGVSSTLILVDGLRSANFPINDDGHNAYVDLNSVPFSLIERTEVLKDGASSTYGADAIGGVVNLILKKQFVGVAGNVEGGVSQHGDAAHKRGYLTVGYGDYREKGFNIYLNAEYQTDGRVSAASRGFPYNTRDITRLPGGKDNNSADSALTTATPNAVVTRVSQTDLNNPLAGMVGSPLTNQYRLLNTDCANGTYTVTSGAAQGTGCKHDLENEYNQLAPYQRKYSFNGRISVRLADNVEGYITGSYSNSFVSILNQPRALRNTQPFGAAPSLASSNPGIVLPVWICPSGVNCANPATPGRTLNPNNPYASAFANDPANGAARIYYLFGDIKAGSDRTNEVIRGTAGLTGSFDGDWNWRVEAVGAKDNLSITQYGYLNIAGLMNAINTGSYNFVNPGQNSAAVRNAVAPNITTPSHSSMASLDASITKTLMALPGGDLQLAVGGQVRREKLVNNNQNARLDTYSLTTSSAFGQHTVSAGYFELDAPVLKMLDINASGRYDHYSEGYSHFSPKVGAKFTPIKQLSLRGTFSKGFRAPTFAESGPRSQYAGFSTYTLPAAFIAAHPGNAAYTTAYSLGGGYVGNPNLKPELSRSFTAGMIVQPTPWLSFTADYYNVKKSRLIVAGPQLNDAKAAYYSAASIASGSAATACANLAAAAPGYSCNVVDAVDPVNPNALPRLLIVNAPFVNANYLLTSGLDLAASATIPIKDGIRLTSHIEATVVFKSDLHTSTGVQKYAGTMGPYELSSGNGTPKWRGNWQNTLEINNFALTATAYYVGKIKEVAADEIAPVNGQIDLSCANNLYGTGDNFCYVKRFINVDMNAALKVNDKFTFYVNVGNVFNARAPIAPASYSSSPNYLTTWHYAGLIGRTVKVGANFGF